MTADPAALPAPAAGDAIARWRAARRAEATTPSGLPVTLQKVNLLDLAAQGRIPTPLIGQAAQLLESDAVQLDLGGFESYAETVNLVVRACVVSPPVADEPDDAHVGIHEIPILDRIWIFNWAQREGAQLATFPEPARERPAAVRGRKGVRAAAQ